MKKNSKIFGLIACSAVLAGAVAIGASNVNVASAAADGSTVKFEVMQKAQVKYGDEAGIRFAATISKDYLATLGENVVLKSSIDKMGNTDTAVTAEWNLNETYQKNYATNTYYHSIGFTDSELDKKAAAGVELTATMWLEADGEEVSGTRQSVTRSMRGVANAVYDLVEDEYVTELDAYLGTRMMGTSVVSYTYTSESYVESGKTAYTTVAKTTMSLPTDYAGYYDVYNGAEYIGTWNSGNETSDIRSAFDGVETRATLNFFDENNNVYKTTVQFDYKAINNAAYWNFRSNKGTSAYPAYVDGAFKITSNLTVGYSYSTRDNKNHTVFKGQLNGDGHSISMTMPFYGVFGWADSTTVVENIAITFTGYSGIDGSDGNTHTYCSLFYNMKGAGFRVENVYLKYSAFNRAGYQPMLIGTDVNNSTYVPGSTIKNVIMDVSANTDENMFFALTMKKNTSFLTRYDATSSYGGYNAYGLYNNVVIITSLQRPVAINDSGSNTWFAQNDTDLKAAWDEALADGVDTDGLLGGRNVGSYKSYQYGTGAEAGVKVVNRYDDYADYVSQEGTAMVGNWSITADGVAWSN